MGYVTYNDNRFEWKGTFEERHIPKEAKWRWDPEKKVWYTTLLDYAGKLKGYFDEKAAQQYNSLLEKKNRKLELSTATSSNFNVPAPAGRDYFPFQKAGIHFVIEVFKEYPGALIADEMGTGKTIQSAGVINVMNPDRVLVVCPASLKYNWERELKRWLIYQKDVIVVNGDDVDFSLNAIYIINYDILHRIPEENYQYNLIIVDECHYIKNPKTKRSKFVKSIVKSSIEQGGKVLFLTGTPIVNRPIELYPILEMAAPSAFGNFWSYAKRYCNAHYNGYGWDFRGASNLEELQQKLRSTIMIRRLKKEVLKELPPKSRKIVPVKLNKMFAEEEIFKLVEDLQNLKNYISVLREFERVGVESADLAEAMAEFDEKMKVMFERVAEMRRFYAIHKAPFAADYIVSLVKEEEVDGLVVFAHHHDVFEIIQKALDKNNITYARITGKENAQERQKAVEDFQSGKVDVVLCSILAAGVGITLTRAKTAVFVELDWVPGNILQAEDRLHRIGQEAECVDIHYIVARHTLDENFADYLTRKIEIIEKALNHERMKTQLEKPVSLLDVITPSEQKQQREEEEESKTISEEERGYALELQQKLAIVAALDKDRAAQRNNVGFNRFDTRIGHFLVETPVEKWSNKMLRVAEKLVNKYRKQIYEGGV